MRAVGQLKAQQVGGVEGGGAGARATFRWGQTVSVDQLQAQVGRRGRAGLEPGQTLVVTVPADGVTLTGLDASGPFTVREAPGQLLIAARADAGERVGTTAAVTLASGGRAPFPFSLEVAAPRTLQSFLRAQLTQNGLTFSRTPPAVELAPESIPVSQSTTGARETVVARAVVGAPAQVVFERSDRGIAGLPSYSAPVTP